MGLTRIHRGGEMYIVTAGGEVPAVAFFASQQAIRGPSARSSLPAPRIIRDFAEPVYCPADGQTYTSKTQYHEALRTMGCEVLGNDVMDNTRPELPSAKQAVADVLYGRVPLDAAPPPSLSDDID